MSKENDINTNLLEDDLAHARAIAEAEARVRNVLKDVEKGKKSLMEYLKKENQNTVRRPTDPVGGIF